MRATSYCFTLFIYGGPCPLCRTLFCGPYVPLRKKKIDIWVYIIISLISKILKLWVWISSPKLHNSPLMSNFQTVMCPFKKNRFNAYDVHITIAKLLICEWNIKWKNNSGFLHVGFYFDSFAIVPTDKGITLCWRVVGPWGRRWFWNGPQYVQF